MGSPESPRDNRDSVVVFFARGSEQPRKDHDAEEQAARDDDTRAKINQRAGVASMAYALADTVQLEVVELYVLVAREGQREEAEEGRSFYRFAPEFQCPGTRGN